MVDLRSLDDIAVPDRWDDIQSVAEGSYVVPQAQPSELSARRRPLLAAAALVLVIGAAFVFARSADPGPVDVAESRDVVVLNDDPQITLAALGPDPAFDASDLGEEVVWDQALPDATELFLLANAEVSLLNDAEITSVRVLGRVDGRLFASRVAVGMWALDEGSGPLGAAIEVREVLEVAGNEAIPVVSNVVETSPELAFDGLRVSGTYNDWPDGDGIFIVEGAGTGAAIVTLETFSGVRLWTRPADGIAVFPVTLNEAENYVVRALDASGVVLQTASDLADPDAELAVPFQLQTGDWLYPATIPKGFALDFALVGQVSNDLVFRGDGNAVVQVSLTPGRFTAGPPDESVDVGGTEWFLSTSDSVLSLSQDTSIGTVVVSAPGLADDVLTATAASLEITSTDRLPIRVIDVVDGPWVDVAVATANGREVTASVTTDGRSYAFRAGTAAGPLFTCCERLAANELVRLASTSIIDLDAQRLVVSGLVDESVARVEVTLADGTSFDLEPQDLEDTFPIDFVFAEVPTVEVPNATVRAIADDGSELGATTGPFPNVVVRRPSAPSQSQEDALRDGIVPELAALSFEDRLSPLLLVRPTDVHALTFDDGTQWTLSRLDPDESGSPRLLGDTSGTYGVDFLAVSEYAEILRLGPGGIERAYPFPGIPPQSLTATDDAIYCFRQGDGALSTSMLCRIDLVTGELTARLFPSTIDPGHTNSSELLAAWLLDDPQPILFETLTTTDDGRLIIAGPDGSRVVDRLTLELSE